MTKSKLFTIPDHNNFFISFTDIVMLLLIFFIYLVSLSSFKSSEMEVLSQHVNSKSKIDNPLKEIITKSENPSNSWDNIYKTIHKQLLPEESIRLSLDQYLLFQPGSAVLIEEGAQYLKQIADALKHKPYEIIVEGHADNTPINTKEFPTNWHLSSMRAAEVAAKLQQFGIPGEHLSSRGFSETRPIIKGASSAEDLKKNRRVQLYIKPLNRGDQS